MQCSVERVLWRPRGVTTQRHAPTRETVVFVPTVTTPAPGTPARQLAPVVESRFEREAKSGKSQFHPARPGRVSETR